jgi:hypothetical protein
VLSGARRLSFRSSCRCRAGSGPLCCDHLSGAVEWATARAVRAEQSVSSDKQEPCRCGGLSHWGGLGPRRIGGAPSPLRAEDRCRLAHAARPQGEAEAPAAAAGGAAAEAGEAAAGAAGDSGAAVRWSPATTSWSSARSPSLQSFHHHPLPKEQLKMGAAPRMTTTWTWWTRLTGLASVSGDRTRRRGLKSARSSPASQPPKAELKADRYSCAAA